MTKDEALKLALDAFGEIAWSNETQWQRDRAKEAITVIKEALAQPEQEPVVAGWLRIVQGHTGFVAAETEWGAEKPEKAGMWMPLYTTPPQRKPLTENEIKHLWYEACQTNLELTSQLIVHLARNIEAAHGIKGEA